MARQEKREILVHCDRLRLMEMVWAEEYWHGG